jgi:gluconate 2-dehydrogenase gamma chain
MAPSILPGGGCSRRPEAAVARLIPKDATGAGALEAGVPNYIDKQLGGA